MVVSLPDIAIGTAHLDDPELIAGAIDMGYRMVDTAQHYGTERAVGEAIRLADTPRSALTVATKIWHDSLDRDAFLGAAEESRERLGVDTIDVLHVHWPQNTYDPVETMGALTELIDDDVVAHPGVSNFTLEEWRRAQEECAYPIIVNQVEMHPLRHNDGLRAHAIARDRYLSAYAPMMAGQAHTVPELRAIAAAHDTTAAAVALAWLATKERVIPITGASTRAHLAENLDAMEMELGPGPLERIDAIERTCRIWGPDGMLIDPSVKQR